MPKRSKKVDTGKKKGTVSKAKSSNSTTQPPNLDLNGSFITPSGGTIVSTASPLQPLLTSDQVTGNDTVLAYLQRIDATNQALLKRVDVLESQRVSTATVQAANVNLGQDLTSRPVSSTNTHLTGVRPVPSASFTTTQAGPSQSAATNTGLFSQHNQSVPPSALHDAVMPDLNNIRANPTISQSVSQIMATLETGSRADKEKNVGFLSHDNITFEFIGPDRPPVLIDSIVKCIEVANIIRSTGVPNYKCARIPIVSKMNVEAWENVLSTYPDGHLLQYIKFGFPTVY